MDDRHAATRPARCVIAAGTADRGPPRRKAGLGGAVAEFAERARAQTADVLARCWNDDTGRYSDRPGVPPTVRAHCDAVEIADLLLGAPPGSWPRPSTPSGCVYCRIR